MHTLVSKLVALSVEKYNMPLTEIQFKTCRFHGSLNQKGSRPLQQNLHFNVKPEQHDVNTVRFRSRMTTSKSVGRSLAPQKTATNSCYVRLQANMSTVGLFANKYIALNHKWNITGNYAERMHKH